MLWSWLIAGVGCQTPPKSSYKMPEKCGPQQHHIPECNPDYYIEPDNAATLLEQCFTKVSSVEKGHVQLNLNIHALGFVKHAKVHAPFENLPFNACLVGVGKRIRFQPTSVDWKLVYPLGLHLEGK